MQQESDGRNLASADSRANPPTDHESPDELDDWDDDWDDNGGDDNDDDHEGPDLPNDWNPDGWKKNVAELNAALTSNTPVVIIAAATAAGSCRDDSPGGSPSHALHHRLRSFNS
jgi:hypothetical protein